MGAGPGSHRRRSRQGRRLARWNRYTVRVGLRVEEQLHAVHQGAQCDGATGVDMPGDRSADTLLFMRRDSALLSGETRDSQERVTQARDSQILPHVRPSAVFREAMENALGNCAAAGQITQRSIGKAGVKDGMRQCGPLECMQQGTHWQGIVAANCLIQYKYLVLRTQYTSRYLYDVAWLLLFFLFWRYYAKGTSVAEGCSRCDIMRWKRKQFRGIACTCLPKVENSKETRHCCLQY